MVLSISLIIIAAIDRRKRGSPLGFVLGLYFSPALMIVIALSIQFAYGMR
ncbi:MAG: hypothetical protein ACNA8P_06310 [Phycisphaerales bacterium]